MYILYEIGIMSPTIILFVGTGKQIAREINRLHAEGRYHRILDVSDEWPVEYDFIRQWHRGNVVTICPVCDTIIDGLHCPHKDADEIDILVARRLEEMGEELPRWAEKAKKHAEGRF